MPGTDQPLVRQLSIRTATADDLPRVNEIAALAVNMLLSPISPSSRSVPPMTRRSMSWTSIWWQRARITWVKSTA